MCERTVLSGHLPWCFSFIFAPATHSIPQPSEQHTCPKFGQSEWTRHSFVILLLGGHSILLKSRTGHPSAPYWTSSVVGGFSEKMELWVRQVGWKGSDSLVWIWIWLMPSANNYFFNWFSPWILCCLLQFLVAPTIPFIEYKEVLERNGWLVFSNPQLWNRPRKVMR